MTCNEVLTLTAINTNDHQLREYMEAMKRIEEELKIVPHKKHNRLSRIQKQAKYGYRR